ncbi:MAG: hypothetical protein NTZ55_03345 [Candidatus Roizmanbacteria bacterium]|nr:hypothetical protein [Candidatus Roizmanbacteria bacterium]
MKKNMILLVVGVLVLAGIGLAIFFSQQKPKVVEQPQKKEEVGAIPTVDASTTVTLTSLQGNKEIVLKSSSVPNGTTSVDYELSYDTKGQGKQGVIGTISSISGNSFEKQMTLGTCSSGRCVYHEVVGAIQVTLKFTGEYGEKVLSKEFTL